MATAVATKAKKASQESIEQLSRIEVCVLEFQNISPLLMDKPPLQLGKAVPKTTKLEDLVESKVYRNANGNLYLPAFWFRAAIAWSAKGYKMSGAGKLGADNILKMSVFPAEEEVELHHPKTGRPLKTWSAINSRNCRRSDGVLIELNQPQIDEWICQVPFEVNTIRVGPKTLENFAQLAGLTIGIGSWRPRGPHGGSGTYGRFTAKMLTPIV